MVFPDIMILIPLVLMFTVFHHTLDGKRKPPKNELIDAASKNLYSWFIQSIAMYLVSLNNATEE